MKYDYIVIGSGISGLVSGIILARQGFRVAVVEKGAQPAPLLRGFKRKGIHFDTGFHYTGSFSRGEILDTYFRHLGIADKLEKIPYDADCFDAFHFPTEGSSFAFPYGYERIRERLHSEFPQEKAGIDTYLQTIREEFNRSPHLNLDILSEALVSFSPLGEVNVKSFLEGLIRDARLRAILSMHYLLYGAEPHQASMSIHAQVSGSLYQSVNGILGGGKALTDALVGRLRELGATLLTGRGVSKVLSSSGSFRGVELEDRETIEATGCISSIHPLALLPMVEETAFRPATKRRFQAFEETSSGFMFSAVVDELPRILDRKNFFLCPDMDLSSYCRTDRPIEERPFFIAAAGGEPGSSACGVILLCPASISEMQPWRETTANCRPEAYSRMKQGLMDRVRDHVLGKVPQIGPLTMLDCATPLTFRNYTNTPSGSLYGIKQKFGQINPSPLCRIKGLFLSGQALAGPGILGGTISAFLACGFILGHQKLRKEVQQCR